MTTATRRKPARSLKPLGNGRFSITAGRETKTYTIREIAYPALPGCRGCTFTNADELDPFTGGSVSYTVRVHADPAGCSCDCKGYLRHRTECKHIGAARTIAERGLLTPRTQPPGRPQPPAAGDDERNRVIREFFARRRTAD